VHVQILFIPTCAACGATAQLLGRLQAETLGLQLEPVPLADHPKLAARSGCSPSSTPCWRRTQL
jgi:hypothetical protein